MNVSECMEKMLDSVIAFDDIWEKEEKGFLSCCVLCLDDVVTAEIKPSKKGCCK